MLRAKVWGPIAVVSCVGLGWTSVDLIVHRPDLRPWVIFLLLLGAAAVSTSFYFFGSRVEHIVQHELSTRARAADIMAFDRNERKHH